MEGVDALRRLSWYKVDANHTSTRLYALYGYLCESLEISLRVLSLVESIYTCDQLPGAYPWLSGQLAEEKEQSLTANVLDQ